MRGVEVLRQWKKDYGSQMKADRPISFSAVLKSFGFKRCKSYSRGIACYVSDCGHMYAEVYTEVWGRWVWVTGKGLPCDPGYPGGKAYHNPRHLHEVLSSCAKQNEKDKLLEEAAKALELAVVACSSPSSNEQYDVAYEACQRSLTHIHEHMKP